MYLPAAFRQDHLPSLHALIEQAGLATLVCRAGDSLEASHLPLLLRRDEGEFGTLYGHFARANRQWQALSADGEALAMFQGVDGYVSRSLYPSKAISGKVVPTWNYTAVHAYGTVEVFDDPGRLLALVGALTARHEAGRAMPWAVGDAPADYIDGMLRAIVGFALPIRRLEGKWKLSQNRSAEDAAGVREGLARSERGGERALAAAMQALADSGAGRE